MIEKAGNYPVYEEKDEKLLTHKALVSMDFEQMLEIANIFYYINKVIAVSSRFSRAFRLFFGLPHLALNEAKRALHKSIHDSMVNCCKSLEEAERCEREGGKHND